MATSRALPHFISSRAAAASVRSEAGDRAQVPAELAPAVERRHLAVHLARRRERGLRRRRVAALALRARELEGRLDAGAVDLEVVAVAVLGVLPAAEPVQRVGG